MTRNINDSGTVTTWEVKPSKAKVYGDPSLLFFLPAICITPGQGSDQSSLAMINMPSETNGTEEGGDEALLPRLKSVSF